MDGFNWVTHCQGVAAAAAQAARTSAARESMGVGVRRPSSSSPPSPTRNPYLSIRREKTADRGEETRVRGNNSKMVVRVFGYGSLIWNPGFDFNEKILRFIKGYKRTFNLGILGCT